MWLVHEDRGHALIGERSQHRAALAQTALRAIDEQPNAHTSGDQPHVVGEEVLPFFQGRSVLSPRRRPGRCHLRVGLIRVRVVGMAVVSVAGWLIVIPFFMSPVVGGVRPAPRSSVSPRGFAERLIPVLAHVVVRSLARQVVEHVCGELVTGIGGTGLAFQERPQLLEVPGDGSTLPSCLMSLLTLLTDLGGSDLLAARSKVVERLDLLVGR